MNTSLLESELKQVQNAIHCNALAWEAAGEQFSQCRRKYYELLGEQQILEARLKAARTDAHEVQNAG